VLQTARTSDSFNYVVVRYLSDSERGITVPVGIVLCNTDQGTLRFRFPSPKSGSPKFLWRRQNPFSNSRRQKSRPGTEAENCRMLRTACASEQAWWDQARKLMAFRFQIGRCRP